MRRRRKKRQRDPWEVRERSLRALGFRDYGVYLDSGLWKGIRGRRFKQKGGRKCSFCPRRAEELHHNDYSLPVMSGRNLKPLLPVCSECHCQGSRSAEGWILRPKVATKKMRELGKPSRTKERAKRPKKKRPKKAKRSPEKELELKKARYARKADRMAVQGEILPSFEEHRAENQRQLAEKETRRLREAAACKATLRKFEDQKKRLKAAVKRNRKRARRRQVG